MADSVHEKGGGQEGERTQWNWRAHEAQLQQTKEQLAAGQERVQSGLRAQEEQLRQTKEQLGEIVEEKVQSGWRAHEEHLRNAATELKGKALSLGPVADLLGDLKKLLVMTHSLVGLFGIAFGWSLSSFVHRRRAKRAARRDAQRRRREEQVEKDKKEAGSEQQSSPR